MDVYENLSKKKINLIFLIFFFLTSSLHNEEKNYFQFAVDSFKKGDLTLTRYYLNELKFKKPSIQIEYDYIKLQYILNLLENQFFYAEQNYHFLQENYHIDDFLKLMRTIHLLQFNQYDKMKEILNEIDYNQNTGLADDKYSVFPFSCESNIDKFIFINITKHKKFESLWRNEITSKELKFLANLNAILNYNEDKENFLNRCLNTMLDTDPQKYHIYRFLLYTKQDIQVYYSFYLYLLQQKKFIEALHILRTIYARTSINDFHYEFYILMLNFKKLYEKLGYIKQVDSLERFLTVLEMNQKKEIDRIELKKIATENKNLREFLWYLYKIEPTEEKRNDYWIQIQQYDEKFDLKERISYYKNLYKYP